MEFLGLIMAGGRGSRLNISVEKPMLNIDGSPMIAHVIKSLNRSPSICKVYVTVSPYTPRTREFVSSLGQASIIETPGLGYHDDMRLAIKSIGRGQFVVVSADLPLLRPAVIERAISFYSVRGRPSLTVIVPLRLFSEMALTPTCIIEIGDAKFVPCGINIIDGMLIDEAYIEESFLVMEDPSLCINVNTLCDLFIAEKFINIRTDKPS